MNISLFDNITGRQRCRQWVPLITQQLRLRHLYQIIAYNLSSTDETNEFYFTLHLTAMSAPFYTSETIKSRNPKWNEIDFTSGDVTALSTTGFVLRIWQNVDMKLIWGIDLSGLVYLGNKLADLQPDLFHANTVILYLRGGYFTSIKQPCNIAEKPPMNLNVMIRTHPPQQQQQQQQQQDGDAIVGDDCRQLVKLTRLKCGRGEVRDSYSIIKLQRLHSLQISIRNWHRDVDGVREQINKVIGDERSCGEHADAKSKDDNKVPSDNVRYETQLLTMTSLNKMLQAKPTKLQRLECLRIRKEIELSKLKTRILMQERDRKAALLRQMKAKYNNLCDDNEERNSQLMENYHHLSREIERMREWKRDHSQKREILQQYLRNLHQRRRQLMHELLDLYPIEKLDEKRFAINGIYLPSSDNLTDCSEGGLSVALGYVSHLLIMCASFLQIPLRYPIQHFGSRSSIEDHITATLSDKTRQFPLYTRGKDRMQFNYAVYLLNKNIAQYLYMLGARTPDLKATLQNVLQLLNGQYKRSEHQQTDASSITSNDTAVNSIVTATWTSTLPSHRLDGGAYSSMKPFGSNGNLSDPILDCIRQEAATNVVQPMVKKVTASSHRKVADTGGPGLSQILAISEAYMSKQMSSSDFKHLMHMNIESLEKKFTTQQDCDMKQEVEIGKEMLPTPAKTFTTTTATSTTTTLEATPISFLKNGTTNTTSILNQSKRLSRSVGSYTDDEDEFGAGLELGSDPLINVSSDSNAAYKNFSMDDLTNVSQQEFLQKWLDSGPNLVCSDENLYPNEVLGTAASCNVVETTVVRSSEHPSASSTETLLTVRTDALLQTKSFNLVKPKF